MIAASTNVALAFGAGMLSFLSPCVLPLVPGYLSLMSGVSTSQLSVATATDTRKVLRSTLLFVAGFTLVFTLFGLSASWLGQRITQNQVLLERISGVVIIVMGLVVAGVVSVPVLQREARFHVLPSRLGAFAPPVMGMAFAFGWTPCIGPQLAAILSIAQNETSLRAAGLLIAYSAGLGVPFVAAGLGMDRLAGVFGWFKRNSRAVALVSGLGLSAFGVLLLTQNVTWLSGKVTELLDFLGLDFLETI